MAKYGAFLYSTAKYGTADAGEQPTATGDFLWSLLIRWDSDWVNEAGRCVAARGNRGKKFYIAQNADTFEQIQPGQFYFTLENYDGRYDPYNTSSPLSGHILPGRPVQFRVKVVANSNQYSIFTGRIRDIRPISGVNQVEVLVVDALQWLADQDITIPVAYAITVDQAIKHTLQAAEYPYPVSLGASYCPVTYFDPDEANALDTIRSLTDAGIGTAFVDASGALRYYDLTKTGITSHSIDQAILLKEIAVTQPWETVRNKITTVANRFGYGPLAEIWRMDEPVRVEAYSTKTFKIEFESCKVIQPVMGVDYVGVGDAFQNGVWGWWDTFFVSLTNITSTGATVVMNNIDEYPVYCQFLVVRGNKIVNKKLTFVDTDSSSIKDYGPRRFKIDSPWLQDRAFAAAYATLLKNFLKAPSKSPVIVIETREDAFPIELLDRIALTSAKLGIDATFDVGALDFQWLTETGQGFRFTFYLQNILYSATPITPDPYIPDLPYVPPVHDPPGGPTDPPDAPYTCLDTMVSSGPTGPQGWSGMVISAGETATLAVQRWFRSIYHPNRTYIDIDALWERVIDGAWATDGSFDFDAITAYNDLNQVVAMGALSGAMVADGVRRYYFNNTHGYYVALLSLALSGAEGEAAIYTPGNELYSGTVAGSNASGVNISGLTIGNWYCIEAAGGPVQVDGIGYPTHISYQFSLNHNGSGWINMGGWHYLTESGYPGGSGDPAGFPAWGEEGVNNYYNRVFFQATADSIDFRFTDTEGNFGNNFGSLGYILRSASATSNRRVTIRSIKIYNFCEGLPGNPI